MGRSDAPGWLLRNRWMMLVAGVWVMCSSGTSYLYSDYSGAIKETLHYDQETLDTVGFFKEVGESVGLLSGLLYDVFPMWAVLLIGAVQLSGGYLMAYLAVAGTLTTAAPPVWAMSLFLCVGANGQTFFITATLVSVVKRFPMSRGMVIGIMKGLIGLSAAVLSQFSKAIYPHSADPGKSVLLFLSWFPVSVVAVAYLFFRSQPTEADSCTELDSHSDVVEYEENEPLYFSVFAGAMLSLAAFLMGIIMLQNTVGVFPASLSRGVSVVTLLLLLLPLGIVYVSHLSNYNNSNNSVVEPLLSLQVQSSELPENSPQTITRIDSFQREFPARGEDHTLLQALQNADFWLLVAIAVIGMGSGLTAMDNVGQVGASLGYSQSAVNSFVSLFSIWNFLGRLGAGAVSELALHERGLSRPLFITCALAAMALGHTILALAFPGALYVGSVLIGVSYGAHWSLVPTATSELFGLRHFGTLLNAVTMASPLGSYFFSVRVAGYFYDAEAHKQHPRIHSALAILHDQSNSKETLSCSGAVCFRSTFFIMAATCTLGCALCALLLARTRKYYTELYDSRQVRTHHSLLRPDMEQPVPSSN